MRTRWAVTGAWALVMVVLAALACGRVGTIGPTTAMLVAATPVVGAAAWVAFAIGIATRRRALGTIAAALTLWHLTIAAPLILATPSRAVSDPPPADTLRVYSANVHADNDDIGSLVVDAAGLGADVILLQEITPEGLDRVLGSEVAATHPHVVADARPGYFGGLVLSRYPVRGAPAAIGGYPMLDVVVSGPMHPLRLLNVHLSPPLDGDHHERWKRQLQQVGMWLEAAGTGAILAGDFNATPGHRELRDVLGRGVDARTNSGAGPGPTFPAGGRLPAVLALDHVVGTPDLEFSGFTTVPAPGSDHHAVLVDVRSHGRPT
jgi:endonuclease/exonuclease/phosphatase (EEP) superfamily protein YafD